MKLSTKEGPASASWVGQRWLRFFEEHAEPHAIVEGMIRARQAVTRRIDIEPGAIVATLQGRGEPRREVRMTMDIFDHAKWEQLVRSMSDQSLFTAKLLAGDMPTVVEDLFAPLGLRLFPASLEELRVTVTGPAGVAVAGEVTADVYCVAALIAERLDDDPFLIFELRGIEEEELRERLRQRRAIVGAVSGMAPAYAPKPIESAQTPAPGLALLLGEFWSPGEGLDEFETPLTRPEVSHALLRRLGPSPFSTGRFPLVGLLATCYDTISEAAIRGRRPADPSAPGAAAEDAGEDAGEETGESEASTHSDGSD